MPLLQGVGGQVRPESRQFGHRRGLEHEGTKAGRVTPDAPGLESSDDGAHGVTRPTQSGGIQPVCTRSPALIARRGRVSGRTFERVVTRLSEGQVVGAMQAGVKLDKAFAVVEIRAATMIGPASEP